MKKIEAMEGKSFKYGGNLIHIESIKHLEADMYQITHPVGLLKASKDELLHDFEPVNTPMVSETNQRVTDLAFSDAGTLGDLSKILMDNIKKVQDDSSYSDQAKVINESAKEIINLQKVKIEALKLVRG